MNYQAILETNAGTLNAVWTGREYIHIYVGAEESTNFIINVWDYAANKPWIEESAEAMARCVVERLNETDPEIAIERVMCSTHAELELNEVCL